MLPLAWRTGDCLSSICKKSNNLCETAVCTGVKEITDFKLTLQALTRTILNEHLF